MKQPRYQGQVKKVTFGTKLVEHLLNMLPSGKIIVFLVKRKIKTIKRLSKDDVDYIENVI